MFYPSSAQKKIENRKITQQVLRGGVRKSLNVNVQDLHAITPASYLECGESVFHDLSYHQVIYNSSFNLNSYSR